LYSEDPSQACHPEPGESRARDLTMVSSQNAVKKIERTDSSLI
jgi:hypothetical protein